MWEPAVSSGSLVGVRRGQGGALARGGAGTPGPAVWKLQETRDTPLSGGRDPVDLLQSLAQTLTFLQKCTDPGSALTRSGRGTPILRC